MDGKEHLRQVFNKRGLLLRSELHVSIALGLRGERGKNLAAYAEVGLAHVRALFDAFEAQSNAAEVVGVHRAPHCIRQPDFFWHRMVTLSNERNVNIEKRTGEGEERFAARSDNR